MLPKKKIHSEEEDVLTLIYAVADAIDAADEIHSPALRGRIEGARLLLQASFGGLVSLAREINEAPHARKGAAHDTAVL